MNTHLAKVTADVDEAKDTVHVSWDCDVCGRVDFPTFAIEHMATLIRVGGDLLEQLGRAYDPDALVEVATGEGTNIEEARAKAEASARAALERRRLSLREQFDAVVSDGDEKIRAIEDRIGQITRFLIESNIPPDDVTVRALLAMFVRGAKRLGPRPVVIMLVMRLLGAEIFMDDTDDDHDLANFTPSIKH